MTSTGPHGAERGDTSRQWPIGVAELRVHLRPKSRMDRLWGALSAEALVDGETLLVGSSHMRRLDDGIHILSHGRDDIDECAERVVEAARGSRMKILGWQECLPSKAPTNRISR